CNGNGILDSCDISAGTAPDCNGNEIPDSCDIAAGTSADINGDGIPDSCEPDCNANNLPDTWEIAQGLASDCNRNGVPDPCDAHDGLDSDCNNNGRLDRCDVFAFGDADDNQNCTPDTCEYAYGDFGLDGAVGSDDLAFLLSFWGTDASLPDLDKNGYVGSPDLAMLLSRWGDTPFAAGNCIMLPWATTLAYAPDPNVVTNAALRDGIIATGLPWRVRDNGTGIEMLLVPPGSFNMGCSSSHACDCTTYPCGYPGVELPVHQVTLTAAFYVGRYEVTQAQWRNRMGNNPSSFKSPWYGPPPELGGTDNYPVEQVTWYMVQGFLASTGLRLPSEAEWEYAYRAGTATAYHAMPGYPDGTNYQWEVSAIAWWGAGCPGGTIGATHPVGQKAANGLGLHDMAGNVFEWVSDWFDFYSGVPQTNPAGPSGGAYKVIRGGSWRGAGGNWPYCSEVLRASSRLAQPPDSTTQFTASDIGFRVARNP
ncbi:MAG: SUMF1/EgtB/PvdO family nonheme iron enzyme, partial [Phycisphaera sp.]|nr:SUMF1/EgtB/PvdO family nonheme iron enzyme [Phycisphaera sp.]